MDAQGGGVITISPTAPTGAAAASARRAVPSYPRKLAPGRACRRHRLISGLSLYAAAGGPRPPGAVGAGAGDVAIAAHHLHKDAVHTRIVLTTPAQQRCTWILQLPAGLTRPTTLARKACTAWHEGMVMALKSWSWLKTLTDCVHQNE